MALYHLSATIIQRSGGQSAVAAAAYRSASKLHDERLGVTMNFEHKTDRFHSTIMLPAGAPERFADRERLWNEVEAGEVRADSQIARDVEFSLPHELSDEANVELARNLVKEMFVDRGMVADLNLHHGSEKNGHRQPHAHVLLTMRTAGADGFGRKERDWNSPALLREWRATTALRINEALARAGLEERVDHRSNAERGSELTPQIKIGQSHLARQRVAVSQNIRRDNGNKIITKPMIALDALTEHQSTFTRAQLERFLQRHSVGREQYEKVLAKVERCGEMVELGVDRNGDERFSTRSLVAIERGLEATAASMASSSRHRVPAQIAGLAVARGGLGEEQNSALAHLLERGDLSLLKGYAGTGKSRLLKAAAEAWSQSGYQVRGAALSGKAAEGLQDASKIPSRTLASWEFAWSQGRDKLEKRDVLVIDEAGMVGSRQMGRVLEAARAAGSKVVLVGDSEQLQAIDAGAVFRALSERHAVTELTHVVRQQAGWMREATKSLATGQTAAAIGQYAHAGRVVESATRDLAIEKLIASWDSDRLERPERSQLIMGYTREDVQLMNELARERITASGGMGALFHVRTERGMRQMAIGERVMFLKNDRDLGVKNGTLGTLVKVKGQVLTVQLDDRGRAHEGALIQVDARKYASLDHGYAATLHKAQGVTVTNTYVLATNHFDRHATYVALSRHQGRASLFYGAEDFGTRERMVKALSRPRVKDMSIDYDFPEPPAQDLRAKLRELADKVRATALGR